MNKHIIFLILIVTILLASCTGPKPLFEIEIEKSSVPATVSFINQTVEPIDSFLWRFGDGVVNSDTNATHEYLMSGRYVVTLEANRDGKSGVIQKEIILNPPDRCLVLMKTSMGDLMIELFEATPKHRDNFLKLAEEGFLDSLLFHRVIEGFMIQGGDPNSRMAKKGTHLGTGGPGYQIEAEFVDSLVHLKGALAAARQGDRVNPERKSSGSQFYIVQGKPIKEQQLLANAASRGKRYSDRIIEAYTTIGGTPQLDWSYTVFGRVIRGLEVVDKIAKVKTNRADRPIKDVRILDIIVIK